MTDPSGHHINWGARDNPPDEPELPCEVCYLDPAVCICPPCPACGEAGRFECYQPERGGSMKLTRAQAVARIRARASFLLEQAEREGQHAEHIERHDGEFSPNIADYPIDNSHQGTQDHDSSDT